MSKRVPIHDHRDINSGGRLPAFGVIIGATSEVPTSGSGSSIHPDLTGRDTAASHPASAVSIVDSGALITATDVEGALAELAGDTDAHIADTADAHDASAVSFSPVGTIAATDVQAAIAEVATDYAAADSAHVAAADPHTGYRLESADHSHATTGLQGGTVAHSALTGVTADQHHAQSHDHSAAADGTALAPVSVTATAAISGASLGGPLAPASIGADQNDYVPPAGFAWFVTATGAARTITGIVPPDATAGRFWWLSNGGATYNLVLADQSASSAAANRFFCPSATNVTIPPRGSVLLVYTGGSWRVL